MSDIKQQDRERYVRAWNDTMIKIWKEKIALLGAVRTGALYRSVTAIGIRADGRYLDITLTQSFKTYGIFVNYGTGKEVYLGNPGDIGKYRDGSNNPNINSKKRKEKPWFSPKYYSSVQNLQDFIADNIGEEGAYVIANALSADFLRVDSLLPGY